MPLEFEAPQPVNTKETPPMETLRFRVFSISVHKSRMQSGCVVSIPKFHSKLSKQNLSKRLCASVFAKFQSYFKSPQSIRNSITQQFPA